MFFEETKKFCQFWQKSRQIRRAASSSRASLTRSAAIARDLLIADGVTTRCGPLEAGARDP